MKNFRSWIQGSLLLAIVALFGAFVFKPAASPGPAQRKAVVVELFTSEGCSSCPPADQLLSRLRGQKSSNGAEIIPLGFHVDYWDYQGWRDRFSSHAFTERQENYATHFKLDGPYTPQMVVDGSDQFVGSSVGRAQEAIAQAAVQPQKADVQLSRAPDGIAVHIHAEPGTAGNVMLAISEDNLSTHVGGGENGGRELRHAAVVRDLRQIGKLVNGNFEGQISGKKPLPKDWKPQDVHYVVFVQSAAGAISGAAELPQTSLTSAK